MTTATRERVEVEETLNDLDKPPNSPLYLTKDEILNLAGLFSVKAFVFMAVKYDVTNKFIKAGEFDDEAIAQLCERWYIKKKIHEIRNILVILSDKKYIECDVEVELKFRWS
jgi:hypothetical protein